jgi:hypothetical protein
LVSEFDAEFPDRQLASMVWNDMQNLPEGKKLKMGLRVAAGIENLQVRNDWLGVMSNEEPFKTKDPESHFTNALLGNQDYVKFVSGWKGDGQQRGKETKEFQTSLTKYAMSMAGNGKMSTDDAVDIAVRRVITDNYGTMQLHGSDVPVHRFPKAGGHYDDNAIRQIELGITDLLSTLSTDSISTDLYHFPLQPRLPGTQAEADRYLRAAIRRSGTVVVEPDGASATVYMKGDGVDDFPFQVRNKHGEPLLFNFADTMARGAAIQKANELTAGLTERGTIIQQMSGETAEAFLKRKAAVEALKAESYRRLGINPKTGKKLPPVQRSTELDYGKKP